MCMCFCFASMSFARARARPRGTVFQLLAAVRLFCLSHCIRSNLTFKVFGYKKHFYSYYYHSNVTKHIIHIERSLHSINNPCAAAAAAVATAAPTTNPLHQCQSAKQIIPKSIPSQQLQFNYARHRIFAVALLLSAIAHTCSTFCCAAVCVVYLSIIFLWPAVLMLVYMLRQQSHWKMIRATIAIW